MSSVPEPVPEPAPGSWTEVARAETERGEVVLRARAGDGPERASHGGHTTTGAYELRVNGVFVMDTVETSTERALASATLAAHPAPRRVVVGGLGLGFTVHEVLADPRVEQVVVVEIEAALVRWMRDGTVPHGPAFLADARLRVVEADLRVAVAEAGSRAGSVEGSRTAYDLVLLDVDNGPDQLVHAPNAEVYGAGFLARVRDLLARGGLLAVWSAHEAPTLVRTLREVFGEVSEQALPVTLQGRDERYWLYLASCPR